MNGTTYKGGDGSYGGSSTSSDCKWGCPKYNKPAEDALRLTLKNGLTLSLSAGGGAGSAMTQFITSPVMTFISGTRGGAGGGGNGGVNQGESGSSATGGPGIGYGSGGGGGSRIGVPNSNSCAISTYSSGSGYQGVVIISYKYK
jgi:hypothetical protein